MRKPVSNKQLILQLRWSSLITLTTLATYILVFQEPQSSVRPEIVLWFLCICPGASVIHCFRMMDAAIRWTLIIALSLTIDATIATILLYMHIWSPQHIFELLILFCLCGVYIQLTLFIKKLFLYLHHLSGITAIKETPVITKRE